MDTITSIAALSTAETQMNRIGTIVIVLCWVKSYMYCPPINVLYVGIATTVTNC